LYSEPTPPKSQLTHDEQKRIILAALGELNPSVFEVVPSPNDDWTIGRHFELAIFDSIQETYALDAVPKLFQAMSEAALAKLIEISAERGAPFTLES
jgi:hypothetical protein